jgi:hypothetical protein
MFGVFGRTAYEATAGPTFATGVANIGTKLSVLIPSIIGVSVSAKNPAFNRPMREEYWHRASISTALEGYRSLVTGENKEVVTMSVITSLLENPAG